MTTPTTVQVRLQVRADTAANWTSNDPVLLANELGRETDTGKIKIGNGSTAWSSLAYQPFGGQITNADIASNAEIAVSKLADGAARQLLQTDSAGTGVEWASNIDIPGTLDVTGAATFDAAVTVQGDLTVNGTTTTIDTTNLAIEDKNIEIGKVTTPTDVTADGGGITLKGTTDKTINWVDATDAWTLSEHVNIVSAKEYRIAGTKVLDATSLGSAVVSSSLTSVGTLTTGALGAGFTTVATGQGGTGQTTYANGELLVGKTDGTLAKATLTAGTGVAVTNADGSITVAVDSTVVTTAQTGTVTSTMIADGTIVNADVNASAAIAGTKISSDFGSQTVQTTGIFSHALGTAAAPTVTFTGDTNTGIFSPGADQFGIATNGVERVEFGTAEVVFNDGGNDIDFRIEGDTNADLFKIDAGLDEVQVANLNGGPLAGTRNRIINGDMRIDQRNAGASVTVNNTFGFYAVDRFQVEGQATDGVFTAQRDTSAPAGFTNSLKLTVTTADASIGASQRYQINHKLEGLNVSDLGFGSANAQSTVLSFWVRSSLTGTFGGAYRNNGANRSYLFSYAISAADTWEYKTIAIPGDTTGTWSTDTSLGLNVTWSLGSGTDFQGAADAWNGNNNNTVTGETQLVGTLNATFYLTGVQLEPGTVATPFERRSFGQELALCQRYFQRGVYRLSGVCNSAGGDASIVFPTPFRASPTLTVNTLGAFVDGFATINITVLALGSTQETSARIVVTAASSTAGRGMCFDGSNLSFTAEL